jgi:hypothetical protein
MSVAFIGGGRRKAAALHSSDDDEERQAQPKPKPKAKPRARAAVSTGPIEELSYEDWKELSKKAADGSRRAKAQLKEHDRFYRRPSPSIFRRVTQFDQSEHSPTRTTPEAVMANTPATHMPAVDEDDWDDMAMPPLRARLPQTPLQRAGSGPEEAADDYAEHAEDEAMAPVTEGAEVDEENWDDMAMPPLRRLPRP